MLRSPGLNAFSAARPAGLFLAALMLISPAFSVPDAVAAQAVATFRVGIRIAPRGAVPPATPPRRRADEGRARDAAGSGRAGRTLVVQPGDTLVSIAIRTYADAARYRDIFAANRDVLASPDILPVGRVLRLP